MAIRLTRTQISAVSEHPNEAGLIPSLLTAISRVYTFLLGSKRLSIILCLYHSATIEILETWIPKTKKHMQPTTDRFKDKAKL